MVPPSRAARERYAVTMSDLTLAGPTLAEFQRARERVSHVAHVTPMESSSFLRQALGAPVYLKCENLQRTGSYKIRGAYNRLSQLDADERARGVVAASAGNHAQGVALAARELGITATIFMPVGVALPKLQATRDYGADVVLRRPLRRRAAARGGRVRRRRPVPSSSRPTTTPTSIAGQGTLGLEILDQVPDVETIVMPIGGGGLISGRRQRRHPARGARPAARSASSACRRRTRRPTRSR